MAEHVPTVVELAHLGLARPVPAKKGQGTQYRVTDEGHKMMGDVMKRNALENLKRGDNRSPLPE